MNRSEKLKEQAKRFAEQHYELYGEIISSQSKVKAPAPIEQSEEVVEKNVKNRVKNISPIPEETGSTEWFAERLKEIDEKWVRTRTLDTFEKLIQDCQKCPLWETRSNLVFGTGNPDADIMVVGEAPGADEDKKGEPFVGAAGKLLTKILEAINFSRDDVYICNIVKSRPPGNRRPENHEVEACIPYLYKQVELVQPRFILALGLTAAKSLLGTNEPMKSLRGKVQDWHGISVIITYHPAALLRNPQWKRPAWEDVQLLRNLYDDFKSQTTPQVDT